MLPYYAIFEIIGSTQSLVCQNSHLVQCPFWL